jgi:hypothetical protein
LTTTATQAHIRREADRRAALDYSRAATRLRVMADSYQRMGADVAPDPLLATFGPTVKARIVDTYEQLAVYLNTAAAQAEELSDQYREILGVGE